jgi:hypothetical protein
MAGYSGTPLAQKLGIKPGLKVALPILPGEVQKEIQAALAACEIVMTDNVLLDLVIDFVTSKKELQISFPLWAGRLNSAGMLWIAWPKKSSGVHTDVDENKIRAVGLSAGLVDVKVCAINETWSGLKFVKRVADRAKNGKAKAARQTPVTPTQRAVATSLSKTKNYTSLKGE